MERFTFGEPHCVDCCTGVAELGRLTCPNGEGAVRELACPPELVGRELAEVPHALGAVAVVGEELHPAPPRGTISMLGSTPLFSNLFINKKEPICPRKATSKRRHKKQGCTRELVEIAGDYKLNIPPKTV